MKAPIEQRSRRNAAMRRVPGGQHSGDGRRNEAVMAQHGEAAREAAPCDLMRKATEALAKDAGSGLTRMDSAGMRRTGIVPGDVMRVIGKRESVAKAMPAFPEDRGK